jgi:nucleotide-binding universal stress UspA family protein
MRHTIVVGVDGSANSFIALSAGADLAEQTGAELAAVFVNDPGIARAFGATFDGTAEPIIEQTVAELAAISRERTFDLLAERHLDWTFDVAAGDAAHELIQVATTRAASVIVVGGRGHNLLAGFILGSVAQKLVRCSPISVLVVRHPHVNERQVVELRQHTT